MNKTAYLLHKFSLSLLTLVLGLAAQATYASLTPEQVQRVNDATTVHTRAVGLLMAHPDVVASGISIDALGEPVIKVLVTDDSVPVPDTVEGLRVHKEVSSRIVALRGPTCDVSGNTSTNSSPP